MDNRRPRHRPNRHVRIEDRRTRTDVSSRLTEENLARVPAGTPPPPWEMPRNDDDDEEAPPRSPSVLSATSDPLHPANAELRSICAYRHYLRSNTALPPPSKRVLAAAAHELYTVLHAHGIHAYFTGRFVAAWAYPPSPSPSPSPSSSSSSYAGERLEVVFSPAHRNPLQTLVTTTPSHFLTLQDQLHFFRRDDRHPWGGHFVALDLLPAGPDAPFVPVPDRSATYMKGDVAVLVPFLLVPFLLVRWADPAFAAEREAYASSIRGVRDWMAAHGRRLEHRHFSPVAAEAFRMWEETYRDGKAWDALAHHHHR